MASLPTHAMAALGLGACFYKPGIPKRIWVIGAVCSTIPDFDVIGFRFGIRYDDFWGHRGFTHSLVFAAVLAVAIVILGFHGGLPNISRNRQSRFVGCDDRWRSRRRIFCAVRQPPVFSSVDSYSGVAYRYRTIFYESRFCGSPK